MSLLQTLRTIRHLKPSQIAGQVRNRVRPMWERPDSFFQKSTSAFPGYHWSDTSGFLAPGTQNNSDADLLAGDFVFINIPESISWPPADWRVPETSKLWQYNLHYFEWLWALEFDDAKAITLDWIDRHPLAKSQVGWEPYPTSLRLMNLCAVFFGKYRSQVDQDPTFRATLWRSIVLQADWLEGHLETHLLGNHLLENGAALAFVGSCFKGPGAKAWLSTGQGILSKEIPEQVLADGMHFERSPMYHIRVAYLLRLLVDTGCTPLVDTLREPLNRMQSALGHLCHPDGQIALFNDSAFRIHNDPSDLLAADDRPGTGSWALESAGYFGYRDAAGTYLICDAGIVGPDYIPGHAHGDMFSFELSLKGHRVIVDSGVYDYVPGEMRSYCRSTSAHNTVEIEGQDQCEFWDSFRVARRGSPQDVKWTTQEEGFSLRAWHNGYKQLDGQPTHERTFKWSSSSGLRVTDVISASRPVTAASRLHLHPSCSITELDGSTATIEYPNGRFQVSFDGERELAVEDSWYCPEFTRKDANKVLTFRTTGKEALVTFTVTEI